MKSDLSKMVLIDHHAHSMLKDFTQLDKLDLRRAFSESRSGILLSEHMQNTLSYRHMLGQLSDLLDIGGEERILEMRSQIRGGDYVQMLFDDASIGGFIIDDGFGSPSSLDLRKFGELSQRPVYRCVRIESVLEKCIPAATSFDQLKDSIFHTLNQQGPARTVGLKTIAAYRGGLKLDRVSEAEARRDFDQCKREMTGTGTQTQAQTQAEYQTETQAHAQTQAQSETRRVPSAPSQSITPETPLPELQRQKFRIMRRPLYHFLLLECFEFAGEKGWPVQIHTGLGDSDQDLLEANPLLWKPLLDTKRFSKTKFVFLHTYPFVRETALLAALYPNAYFDISLVSFQVSAMLDTIFVEALAAAPFSKILAATDGHTVPETYWYASHSLRSGLAMALDRLTERKLINEEGAAEIAAAVFHGNAQKLYSLNT